MVIVDLGRLRRLIEKSRDGVLSRAGYSADLFGTCLPRIALVRVVGIGVQPGVLLTCDATHEPGVAAEPIVQTVEAWAYELDL
jgi:hypothetical protein